MQEREYAIFVQLAERPCRPEWYKLSALCPQSMVENLLLSIAYNQGLLIVIAFGTILYLGVDYFGVVQYFTAVGAFPGAFYSHFT